jgi:hypothetical protein
MNATDLYYQAKRLVAEGLASDPATLRQLLLQEREKLTPEVRPDDAEVGRMVAAVLRSPVGLDGIPLASVATGLGNRPRCLKCSHPAVSVDLRAERKVRCGAQVVAEAGQAFSAPIAILTSEIEPVYRERP